MLEARKEEKQENKSELVKQADKILGYLTPIELASVSLTCKELKKASEAITRYRISDASHSLERTPIPFVNSEAGIPPYAYFLYTQSSIPHFPHPGRQHWGPHGDAVVPREEDRVRCGCLVMGEAGVVTECGPGCELGRGGVRVQVRVMWDRRKGWGLVLGEGLSRGHFVCEYAGELLTTKEARRRQQLYDDLASSEGFTSALLVIREHLPSRNACFRINIDATRIGNVARFINHSCDGGNLSTVLVRRSGDLVPRLCFFASRDIREGEELTFSYGDTRVRSKGLQCFCGSKCCVGTLPSEHT